jgi:UDP-N-acetylglucosamine--N-acetylmuramyl-(pentapeptide) pyrophosphoryl-undecaprenol N-acetylglucosamine transferase
MKVVIAGGGTGGHLYPGIAVARALLHEEGNEVLFIGTEQGIEARVLPKEGLAVRFITVGKLKGMKLLPMLKTMAALPLGMLQSLNVLREARPDAVFGVGGYASGPVGLAAISLNIPLVIMEPNSYPGLANRNLGKLARTVVLCFPGAGAQGFFPPEKTVTLGPLVRKGIEQGDRHKALADFGLASGRFTVFVMGGSGGAHALNMVMKQTAVLLKDIHGFQILHQTGEHDAVKVAAGYSEAGVQATVRPYIDDMASAYALADLVISRAGATTVAELAVCGKRAVLVPFPFAADNHQEYNASMLAARGGAEVVPQQDLSAELLARLIKKYAEQGAGSSNVPRMANTAAEEIAALLKKYVQKN